MYYIYALLNTLKPGEYIYGDYKFDYEPFYIGKGKAKRIKTTLNKRNNNYNKKIIASNIKKAGKEIVSILLHDSIENEMLAYDLEKNIISIIGRSIKNEGPLTNISTGGKYDKNILDKIKLGHGTKKISNETRLKISLANKGRIKTEEERKKLSISHTGKKLSEKTKLKLSNINSVPKPNIRKTFEIISPNGIVYITNHLEEFCIQHGLNYNSMTALSRGKRKTNNHKNWKCKKI
jgi:hypothetical protein